MRLLFLPFLFITVVVHGQLDAEKQKAINNFINYANDTQSDVKRMTDKVIKYYPGLLIRLEDATLHPLRYSCSEQLKRYYIEQAKATLGNLGFGTAELLGDLSALESAVLAIDRNCKLLDTYHQLGDYQNDKYKGALRLIKEIPDLVRDYKKKLDKLAKTINTKYGKTNANSSLRTYYEAEQLMKAQIEREKSYMETMSHNLNQNIHSEWSVKALEQNILESDQHLKEYVGKEIALKYPVDRFFESFVTGMSSLLKIKRTALDTYNSDAQKSDKHRNSFYAGLINYFNGTMISNYNNFIKQSRQHGYYGFNAIKYCGALEIVKAPAKVTLDTRHYEDILYVSISPVVSTHAISKNEAISLNNYVDYINSALHQVVWLQRAVHNLSSSAKRYRGLKSFEGRGGLTYSHDDFHIPHSLYQKAVSESTPINVTYAKSINNQAEVILRMLKEMEQLNAALELETKEKLYEKDNLDNIYAMFERYKVLFDAFDVKKERLNLDVRKIYDSYAVTNTNDSWIKSWKALRKQTDHDYEALMGAKAWYKGENVKLPGTEAIDNQLREVIANEYDNMEGIRRLGRNHGGCPYTPYEDIPKTSKRFAEKIKKLPEGNTSSYRSPYDDIVYLYNDVVDDYNKFCKLSGLELLKTVRQPALFVLVYPEGEQPKVDRPIITPKNDVRVTQPGNPSVNPPLLTTGSTSLVRDTVYIEKRDTIYIDNSNDEDLYSMEGYATNNLVLLLDVSGSMDTPDKLPLLKHSVIDMLKMMRQEDQVAIVVYSGKARVLLKPTSFKDELKVKQAINNLKPSGKTDGNAGIRMAFDVADKSYVRGGNNRIILATDGEFPINPKVRDQVEGFAGNDIFLTVFNFAEKPSRNLEALSSKGGGNYVHITPQNIEGKLIREVKSKKKK